MTDWALLADQAWRVADQAWRVVMCTILLAIAITEYREGKTIPPAFCVVVALVSAASVQTP